MSIIPLLKLTEKGKHLCPGMSGVYRIFTCPGDEHDFHLRAFYGKLMKDRIRREDILMKESVLEVKGLVKSYKELKALCGLDLDVKKGEIFGLLGPNGSGKTTAMNCILGLLNYDSGSIRVFGQEMTPSSYDIRRRIGVVPQNVAVSDELNVQENIDFFCGLYVDDKKERKLLTDRAIDFAGLSQFRKFRPKKLSGGLLRRLNIACGIAHRPELIFLDEPTVAVDPQSRSHILDGIEKLREDGATIIYTTHYMEEVEQICDRVAIIDAGKNIALGTVDELKKLSAHYDPEDPPTLNDIFLEITGKQLRD